MEKDKVKAHLNRSLWERFKFGFSGGFKVGLPNQVKPDFTYPNKMIKKDQVKTKGGKRVS